MNNILGIIGGSGLYEFKDLKNIEEISIDTPFGKPSDVLIKGDLYGHTLIFLPRHGKNHRIPPSDVNYRANIYALKVCGVSKILSVSAVGSMKEEIQPGDMVVVSQFIDRTHGRKSTFFTDNIVAHVSFADPVCKKFSEVLYSVSKKVAKRTHKDATYICINGPQFSTRAESHLYRSWGVDIIGMTNLPEAKLAREAGICYATLALATDYDCWRESDDVNALDVVKIIKKNVENAKKIIIKLLEELSFEKCECHDSLKYALLTDKDTVSEETWEKLKPIIETVKKGDKID
jgi:5'-methylthioadenosine phosphorylase